MGRQDQELLWNFVVLMVLLNAARLGEKFIRVVIIFWCVGGVGLLVGRG